MVAGILSGPPLTLPTFFLGVEDAIAAVSRVLQSKPLCLRPQVLMGIGGTPNPLRIATGLEAFVQNNNGPQLPWMQNLNPE